MSRTALATYPNSYSEVCDTFRPRRTAARRTNLGRHSFVHFLKPCAALDSFVAEQVTKGRPACIQNGLRHFGFGQGGGVDVADRDVIEGLNQLQRFLVQKIGALIHDLRVNGRHLAALAGALRDTQAVFQDAVMASVLDLVACGQGGEVLQPCLLYTS